MHGRGEYAMDKQSVRQRWLEMSLDSGVPEILPILFPFQV
jgi:hypothetical protein